MPQENTILYIIIVALVIALTNFLTKNILIKIIASPFVLIFNLLYKWIAPRNPFSISMHQYKKHILRSNLAKIENPVGPPIQIPLEHAYAPLKLITSEHKDNVDLFEYTELCDRFIVLGGPGTGKTTIMKSLLTNILKKTTQKKLVDLIPVFVVLRKLASSQHNIEEAIISSFNDHHFPKANKFVLSALEQGRMLIILDGLDEVGVNREFVSSKIKEFCEHDEQQDTRNHIILTCRENSYQKEELRSVIPNIVKVEPFGNDHMRTFLLGWPIYKGKSAIKLYSQIQDEAIIRDICRNPLLLTILTGLYLEEQKFNLPTSRNRFYKASLKELFENRPARRGIQQDYEAIDKGKILEKISLEGLETIKITDDPEEFSTHDLKSAATKVLQKKFDFSLLVKELVDVNGIIKPSGEDTYTFTHRTIQEYLAAREAKRTRTPDDVINSFDERDDLSEVIYFYCGLLDNLPQITDVLRKFIQKENWIKAGKCLLNMKELPQKDLITEIGNGLYTTLISGVTIFGQELDVLSSLAQRKDIAFKSLNSDFNKVINHLIKSTKESEASTLETVLSSSPEMALKVIPGLLQHQSDRWKKAGVKLLRDIGTDEALDKLVQLLRSEEDVVKIEAAKHLSSLIKTRKKDLIDRKDLLPPRIDTDIWPFNDDIFPSNIAIPISESIALGGRTTNKAIKFCADAIKLTSSKKPKDIKFCRKWKRLLKHLKINSYIRKFGLFFRYSILTLGIIIPILFFNLLIPKSTEHISLLNVISFEKTQINKEIVDNVFKAAKTIDSEIKEIFPREGSFFNKALPWNWGVRPFLPKNSRKAYSKFQPYTYSLGSIIKDLKEKHINKDFLVLFSHISDKSAKSFHNAIEIIRAEIAPIRIIRYVDVTRSKTSRFSFIFAVIFSFLIIGYSPFRLMARGRFLNKREYHESSSRRFVYQSKFKSLYFFLTQIFTLAFMILVFNSIGTSTALTMNLVLYLFFFYSLLFVVGHILEISQLIKNPCFSVILDISPSAKLV